MSLNVLHKRPNDPKNLSLKPYGTVYSTYELPGTRIYRNNEVKKAIYDFINYPLVDNLMFVLCVRFIMGWC